MDDLLAARSQMAVSLGFHILFAAAGMAMPLLMAAAEGLWLKTGDKAYLELAQRWAKGTAALFAVGAVSGTVLSFELGLLWPRFMEHAGPVIGMPFSLEGLAFFLEAIFLGIYLYGWEKVPPRLHWLCGVMVLLSGLASGVFVVTVNAWMNTPAGFTLAGGAFTDIRPFAAMVNPASLPEVIHMSLAAFVSVGFTVAAVHAWILLKDPASSLHRKAFAIALCVGGAAALLQPLSGDFSARHVARHQKVKLAAMEGHWVTQRRAPLRLFGLEIPAGLSLLAYRDADAEVMGLYDVPEADRPPSSIVHLAFQLMLLCGALMAATAVLGGFLAWRRKAVPLDRPFLKLVVLCGPLGFLALEAGWTVTEVGRQPWIIQGVMRVRDALTPMPGLMAPFAAITLLYLVLSVVVLFTLRRLFLESADAP